MSDCPRVIRTTRPVAVADTWSYTQLRPFASSECPVPCPANIWKEYLTQIARRRSDRKTGQVYYLNEIAWIDGFEDDSTREAVVEAMLRKPGRYDKHRTAKLGARMEEKTPRMYSLPGYLPFASRIGRSSQHPKVSLLLARPGFFRWSHAAQS